MKICTTCKENLPDIAFASRFDKSNPTLQSSCKNCQKEYRKKHYEENKEKYILKAKNYTDKIVKWFEEFKTNLQCQKCGESRWWLLDFHHRNPKEKEGDLSRLARSGSKKKLEEEIKKCDILCANCHRDLHHRERQAGNA